VRPIQNGGDCIKQGTTAAIPDDPHFPQSIIPQPPEEIFIRQPVMNSDEHFGWDLRREETIPFSEGMILPMGV